jgi:hypothetical protein
VTVAGGPFDVGTGTIVEYVGFDVRGAVNVTDEAWGLGVITYAVF